MSAHYDSDARQGDRPRARRAPRRSTGCRAALAGARLVGVTTNRDSARRHPRRPGLPRRATPHRLPRRRRPRPTPITRTTSPWRRWRLWLAEHAAEQARRAGARRDAERLAQRPAAGRTIELRHAGGTIRVSDGPRRVGVLVDDVSIDVGAVEVHLLRRPTDSAREIVPSRTIACGSRVPAVEVVLEVGGLRRRVTVTAVGAQRYVDGHDGHVVVERLPRHPEPRAAGRPGRSTAPMPGVVRRVRAAVGDGVEAGPDAGGARGDEDGAPDQRRRRRSRRRRVAVAPGQQVDGGHPAAGARDRRDSGRAPVRIANCSGFYGDRLSAAREMVEGGPIDVLTGDWLAELTMLILPEAARQAAPAPATPARSSPRWSRCSAPASTAASRWSPTPAGSTPAGCADAAARPRRPSSASRRRSPTSRATTCSPRLDELRRAGST